MMLKNLRNALYEFFALCVWSSILASIFTISCILVYSFIFWTWVLWPVIVMIRAVFILTFLAAFWLAVHAR